MLRGHAQPVHFTYAGQALRTRRSDESSHAGLFLRNWHGAHLLPELEETAQCLRDDDMALSATGKVKRAKLRQQPIGRTPRKKRGWTGAAQTPMCSIVSLTIHTPARLITGPGFVHERSKNVMNP